MENVKHKKKDNSVKDEIEKLRCLIKARTTKYVKKLPKPGGGFRYIYSRETIKEQKREQELTQVQKLRNEAKNISMTFGKYKGKTVYEVLQENPKYLLWAGNNTNYDEAILGKKIYVGGANFNTKMEFGKHEGRTIKEIMKFDISYLEFLSNEGFSENHLAVAFYEKIKTAVTKNPEKIPKTNPAYKLAQMTLRERKTQMILKERKMQRIGGIY